MFETITYQTPNGQDVSGYLARAAGNSTKSIVVIQEWWGLNDQIRGVADRFAAAGFNALAPDLYNGRVTENADEAGHMMDGLDWVGGHRAGFARRGTASQIEWGHSRRYGLLYGWSADHPCRGENPGDGCWRMLLWHPTGTGG